MNFVKSLIGGFGLLASLVLPSFAAEKTIIVFDASGSMWAQIDGKSRIEIARETIGNVLAAMPVDRELGLMVYGHREKGSCTDIELVVPPAAGTAAAISAAVNKISPKGKTPLSAAVKQAAEALKYTEEKATVILITDGLETCDADPCALGNELEKSGVDFTAHVVGFGLTEDEGKKVSCLATNTGGKYIQASDAKTLTEALQTTVVEAPAPAPKPAPAPEPAKPEFNLMPTVSMAEDGENLGKDADMVWELYATKADGSKGDRITTEYHQYKAAVEPGNYFIVAALGRAITEQPVTIEPGKVAEPHFILNAGTIIIHPYANQGAEISEQATVVNEYPGDKTTNFGDTKLVVPAGAQTVTVTIGAGSVTEKFDLKAGETVEKDMIAGTGHVLINVFYVDGMKVDSGNLSVKILQAAKKIDGSRDQLGYNFGPDSKYDLPAGDYIALIELDGVTLESPFSVKVGDNLETNIMLNAGILAVKAPLYDGWKILGAKPKIDGSSDQFAYGFGTEWQSSLVAGDYVIVTTKPDGTGEKKTPVTIKAGERLELTIE